jgi:NAD(P)-dependent dehydrogenase (short-subunit alcohol dehydrogenase family)
VFSASVSPGTINRQNHETRRGSGLATRVSFPGLADYSATKAAVIGNTKGATRDLAPRKIIVNGGQSGSIGTA